MVEKFNEYLIIVYPKNKYTNVYKRVINKIYHDRYEVIIFYRDKKVNKSIKVDTIYNSEQIEKIIDGYIKEFNLEKTLFYK